MSTLRYAFAFALLTPAVMLHPCSLASAGDELASVTGKVTLDGRPLPDGKVFIHLGDGQFVGCKVKDGSFKIGRVPVGKHKVTVEMRRDGLNALPARYSEEKLSALRIEVQKGANVLDLLLTSK
jgi:hypothetical protein